MFEQSKNSELHILSTPSIITGTFDTGVHTLTAMLNNMIPGITDFGYDHDLKVERKGAGQWKKNKPVGIIDSYAGIKGSFDVEGHDGEKAVLAAINKIALASYKNAAYNRLFPVFLMANVETDDGTPMKCHFCWNCKIDAIPKKVSPDAKRFSFQGIYATDFEDLRGKYFTKDGAATPVTSIPVPTGDTAISWTDEDEATRYTLAMLVYRTATGAITVYKEVASAPAAGEYSATGSTITMNASDGLATGDKALIAYLVNA